jgi:hypothetical protein
LNCGGRKGSTLGEFFGDGGVREKVMTVPNMLKIYALNAKVHTSPYCSAYHELVGMEAGYFLPPL